jgi:hypothetical protein
VSWFDSPYDGTPGRGEELYQRCLRELPADLSAADLALLERHARERLRLEQEERRMHFGALALTGVLFFLVLPSVLRDPGSIALDLLALLLLALAVPYVFVYFAFENRVRRMGRLYLRLLERG